MRWIDGPTPFCFKKTMKHPINHFKKEAFRRLLDQVGVDPGLLVHEVYWAMGEVRINRVTPTVDQFLVWKRRRDGLAVFGCHVRDCLKSEIDPEDVRDLWECVDLTLNAKKRKSMGWQECLVLAITSDAKCEQCGKEPPSVTLEIDHILPVSKGGGNSSMNLRFLCTRCNRARGNRFRWADVWRRVSW